MRPAIDRQIPLRLGNASQKGRFDKAVGTSKEPCPITIGTVGRLEDLPAGGRDGELPNDSVHGTSFQTGALFGLALAVE